jgi:hypothetical protein
MIGVLEPTYGRHDHASNNAALIQGVALAWSIGPSYQRHSMRPPQGPQCALPVQMRLLKLRRHKKARACVPRSKTANIV